MTIKDVAEREVKDFKWPQFDGPRKKMIFFFRCADCPFSSFVYLQDQTYSWTCDEQNNKAISPDVIDTDCPIDDYEEAINL